VLFDLFANIVGTTSSDWRLKLDPTCICEPISVLASDLVVPTSRANRPNSPFSADVYQSHNKLFGMFANIVDQPVLIEGLKWVDTCTLDPFEPSLHSWLFQ
jgi:hypothetical protein